VDIDQKPDASDPKNFYTQNSEPLNLFNFVANPLKNLINPVSNPKAQFELNYSCFTRFSDLFSL
jgi:hypothetical protein